MSLKHCRLLVRRLCIQSLQPLTLGISSRALLVPLQDNSRELLLLLVQRSAHVIALLTQSFVFSLHAVQERQNVFHLCLGRLAIHGGDPQLLREVADLTLQLGHPLSILLVATGDLLQGTLELTLIELRLGTPVLEGLFVGLGVLLQYRHFGVQLVDLRLTILLLQHLLIQLLRQLLHPTLRHLPHLLLGARLLLLLLFSPQRFVSGCCVLGHLLLNVLYRLLAALDFRLEQLVLLLQHIILVLCQLVQVAQLIQLFGVPTEQKLIAVTLHLP
mmetsp:Transcript_40644/g.97420  ORF Transcript_40644/g.97420 Transcript_40644/m.97420 type:complete len:273 (-) Transcript_40644:513-1331(-)